MKNNTELCFFFCCYFITIFLNSALTEKKTDLKSAVNYSVFTLSCSWKLLAADWYWFNFLQRDLQRLKRSDIICAMSIMKMLDPHFTSVFRLGVMNLLTYHQDPLAALCVLNDCMQSHVNQADWRMHGYFLLASRMMHKNCHEETARIVTQLALRPQAGRLSKLEIPEMPDYLLKINAIKV